MNLIEQMNVLKGLDDAMLQREVSAPSGSVPPYLVLSEMNRRKDMRSRYEGELARRKPQTTVAQDMMGGPMAAAPSIAPAPMGSGAGIAAAAAPAGGPGFADGGLVDYADIAKRYTSKLDGLDDDRDRARALALIAASAGMLGGGHSNTLQNLGLGINAGVQSYGTALDTIDSREAGYLKDLVDLDTSSRARTAADTPRYYSPAVGTVNGKPAYVQFGDDGSVVTPEVPEGFVPQSRYEKVDAGDSWIIIDTTTGLKEVVPKQGAPSADMNVTGLGPDRVLTPATGSDEALKRAAAAEKTALGEAAAAQTADVVTTDIDRAITAIDNNPGLTTGWGALLTQDVGAGPAADVKRLIETVKANVSFDKLQSMRNSSPTGAALGPVSDFENKLLQATIGNLELSQNKEQLLANLERVKEIYTRIVTTGIEDPNNPRAAMPSDDIDAIADKYLTP
jgi:hypothetical protein